jgi:hypothetical protein
MVEGEAMGSRVTLHPDRLDDNTRIIREEYPHGIPVAAMLACTQLGTECAESFKVLRGSSFQISLSWRIGEHQALNAQICANCVLSVMFNYGGTLSVEASVFPSYTDDMELADVLQQLATGVTW